MFPVLYADFKLHAILLSKSCVTHWGTQLAVGTRVTAAANRPK